MAQSPSAASGPQLNDRDPPPMALHVPPPPPHGKKQISRACEIRRRRSRPWQVRVGLAATAFVLASTGCKKQAPTSAAPEYRGLSDDIENLEAEIAANADLLQGEGIYLAAVDPETTSAAEGQASKITAPETEPPPPAEPPPKPEPEPEREPGIVDYAYEDEEDEPGADEAPTMAPPSPVEDSERDRRATRRERRLETRRAKKEAATRCERICELAAVTCDLSDHVCGLARKHPDEPRYEAACERSAAQCEAAADACNACASP